ncbi:MAG: tyrosine-type recombinase/integrase, partial [Clostridia bacterium]|nr:tyrosine-type recombinase/integrase [Clostridia bacterium]
DRNKGTGKKPNWEYRFEAAKIGDKRQHISKSGFRTKKEAQEAGAKALAEYNDGGIFRPSEISFSDFLDFWFEYYCKKNLKQSTLNNYASSINKTLKPYFGKYKLSAISTIVIENFLDDLKNKQYAYKTIHRFKSMMCGILNYAVHPCGYIKSNPAQYVRQIKNTENNSLKHRSHITHEEFRELLNMCENHEHKVMLLLGWHCGLRFGEVSGLTWDNIDLENRQINITQQLFQGMVLVDNKKVSYLYLTTPKCGSQRTITFGDELYNTLIEHKEFQKKQKEIYGEQYFESVLKKHIATAGDTIHLVKRVRSKDVCEDDNIADFVCRYKNGRVITKSAVKYINKRFEEVFGFTFHYHMLRKGHATLLNFLKVDLKTIQARLGHKSLAVTADIYTKPTKEADYEAAKTFDEFVKE